MKIEDYIKSRKNDIDSDIPDVTMLWHAVQKQLNDHKYRRLYNFIKVTASVLLIIGISIFFHSRRQPPMYQISIQLGKKEKSYIEAVNVKMKETNFKQIKLNVNNEVIKSLIGELLYTDTIYTEVMNDIKNSGCLEENIDVIFDTYEKKIELLNRIYLENQKEYNYEKEEENVRL